MGFSAMKCTFALNNKAMSAFKIGAVSYPAFSGTGPYTNKLAYACLPEQGPIPAGLYHIVDRQEGGLWGSIKSAITGRSDWFALYADDGKIDDVTFCNKVARGMFRLHPKGPMGISKGCITIESGDDFTKISRALKDGETKMIDGGKLKSYGTVLVTI